MMVKEEISVRLDKWLWASRFFKTRSQAAQAVTGGKVHVNGARCKPARSVNIDDELRIQKGPFQFVVHVRALSSRRGPAVEARKLYEETEESIAEREVVKEESRFAAAGHPDSGRRPNKRDRRLIKKFIRK